ncbi:MAG TPA: PAS domain S-box protein [Bryobacteraceae bacterium]|nr:PAS domain S-box protein [Bryobacteraceae bacterium]
MLTKVDVQDEVAQLRARVRDLENALSLISMADRRLAAIVESSDDAIIGKDLHGIIQSWNPGAERTFGYTADEVIGRPISILVPPERADETPRILAQIARGERVEHYETQRRTKDGRILTVSLSISPIKNSAGAIIGVSKIARDITEREQSIRREQQALRTAELLNQVGLTLASELDIQKLAQTVTDIATQLVRAEFGALFHNLVDDAGESYTLYTLSGAPREAFAGFPLPRNTDVFGPTFRGEGVVRSDDITKDPRYGRNAPYAGMPEGHLPVRSYLAVPVISRSGDVLGGLFFGHSQTGVFTQEAESIVTGIAAQAAIALDNAALFAESQRSQKALRRSNEELSLVNEDLSQFARSASHDLREPLRMISIYTQLLGRKLKDQLDVEAQEYLHYVLSGARRMEDLIRDLLTFTQVSSVGEGPAPPIDAGEALQSALSNLAAAIEDAGASITYSSLPSVRIPRVHLTQLFQNLIGNAVKYKSTAPHIRIDVERCQDQWRFSVQDNGIGIAEHHREQIFGLFKRLHPQSEYSGTGLGLAICQRIIQRAGGRIWVESEPGQGSTFFFTLPAAD